MAVSSIPADARVASDIYVTHPEKKLTLYFVVTGFLALLIGALIGPLQALNYAGINVYQYLPFLKSYYQGLTLHGVLNVLVFTTFFISGWLLYVPARSLNMRPNMTFSWAAYWVMLLGLIMAGAAIVTDSSTVLYTFYPPLQGHWAFYLGLALVVVGSLMTAIEVTRMWVVWKRQNPGKVTPLPAYMSLVTWLMWMLASLGVVSEVLFLLLPWSLGWVDTVDSSLARTLFWFTGHPIVYFWLLPAYVAWYGMVPRQTGGDLVSDPLTRLVFLFFLLFSTPVGFHHQFSDPGITPAWKFVHSTLTSLVAVPSLITAFTIGASLEKAGRANGGRGLFGWIPKLNWRSASFTAQVLAMFSFIFGGAGGVVNASFGLNAVIHNTAWVPGHFHLTIGSAVTLTFFGISFWLLPNLTRKKLFSNGLALASTWLWFVGMMIFSFGMHWQGILAVPRRAHISNLAANLQGAYADAAVPQFLTGLGGVILLFSVIFYFIVFFGTLLGKRVHKEEEVEIPWAATHTLPSNIRILKVMDHLFIWWAFAFFIVLAAYGPTLLDFILHPLGVPGWKLW